MTSGIPGSKSDTDKAPQGAQAVSTRAVGLLAAGLAHDLNNMLAGISATAELAAERMEGEDREDMEAIVEQAARAGRLIRQLLAFSRQEMLLPVQTDPTKLLEQLRQILQALVSRDIELAVDIVDRPQVKIDLTALERIIVNLVVNARDAIRGADMLEGARILLRCERVPPAGIPAQGRAFMPEQTYCRISIDDTGPGIPPEIAARIFEPYFTTRPEGQGLGLSSAYGLVKQSGGFLLVERSALGGARFEIYLPDTTPAGAEVANDTGPATAPLVLVAEDEMLLRISVARGLQRAGYQVMQAPDGEAAVQLLETVRPALLMSDIRMPGMDGVELARTARQRYPDLPVLLVSGYADEGARNAVPGMQVSFLEKPFTMKRLEEVLTELL